MNTEQHSKPPPSACDLCGVEIGSIFYDARVGRYGWADICPHCFAQHDGQLGTGKGQRYQFDPVTGRYLKTAG